MINGDNMYHAGFTRTIPKTIDRIDIMKNIIFELMEDDKATNVQLRSSSRLQIKKVVNNGFILQNQHGISWNKVKLHYYQLYNNLQLMIVILLNQHNALLGLRSMDVSITQEYNEIFIREIGNMISNPMSFHHCSEQMLTRIKYNSQTYTRTFLADMIKALVIFMIQNDDFILLSSSLIGEDGEICENIKMNIISDIDADIDNLIKKLILSSDAINNEVINTSHVF
jgi:hypothetical protein